MFVLIDPETMSLLHKHSSVIVIINIAEIECQSLPYHIFSLEGDVAIRELAQYTDLELQLLYRGLANSNTSGGNKAHLQKLVVNLLNQAPESDIVLSEVLKQAVHVKEGSEKKWKYVKGANTPTIVEGLFDKQPTPNSF